MAHRERSNQGDKGVYDTTTSFVKWAYVRTDIEPNKLSVLWNTKKECDEDKRWRKNNHTSWKFTKSQLVNVQIDV